MTPYRAWNAHPSGVAIKMRSIMKAGEEANLRVDQSQITWQTVTSHLGSGMPDMAFGTMDSNVPDSFSAEGGKVSKQIDIVSLKTLSLFK